MLFGIYKNLLLKKDAKHLLICNSAHIIIKKGYLVLRLIIANGALFLLVILLTKKITIQILQAMLKYCQVPGNYQNLQKYFSNFL